ncbi:MFS general substrate transporter [Chiua virens]|nr:MFS general substrate transporter [Chiua virens]
MPGPVNKSDHAKPKDDVREGVLPLFQTHFASDQSLRTLYKEDASDNQDLAEVVEKHAKDAGDPPDGGLKAWSVILGTCLATGAALGYVTAWGIFQKYYEEVLLPNESPSDIAWIGSVQVSLVNTALCFLPGLIAGRLFDLGYFKIPFFLASCFLILCTFLVAECTEWWQLFLLQGLGTGLACGMVFGLTMGVVPHWFSKRRGLALGISSIGSSVGGTIFPIAAQNLIAEIGFKWTIRTFGFIVMFMLGIAILTIDRRLPPVNVKGGLFNWAALKNPAYGFYCISGVVTFLGLYTVLTYIPLSAVQAGVSNDFALYLTAFANAASAVGRISCGYLADRVGAMNVMIPFTILVAVMTFVWPFVTSQGGLIAVALIYGFAYGTYISLCPVPVMAMGPTGDVGRRIGLFLSFIAFGALAGTPLSGAINSATGGFEDVGWRGRDGFGVLAIIGALSSSRQVEWQVLKDVDMWCKPRCVIMSGPRPLVASKSDTFYAFYMVLDAW